MTLAERLLSDSQDALRAGHTVRTATLRLLREALRGAAIAQPQPLDDGGVVQVIQRPVKRRRAAIQAYAAAGRPDLAAQEQAELDILAAYLPASLGADALQAAAAAIGAAAVGDLGRVRQVLMPQVRGQASGTAVSAGVRALPGG